jgi:hypothetical protein
MFGLGERYIKIVSSPPRPDKRAKSPSYFVLLQAEMAFLPGKNYQFLSKQPFRAS